MASQRGLKVRGSERQYIELPVELTVEDEYCVQVRFSATSPSSNQHAVAGVTFDLSVGGLGFKAPLFLPRHCEGTIRVMSPAMSLQRESESGNGAGFDMACVRITHRVKVRRVWMNDTDGSYFIGLAFVNPTPLLEEQISVVLREVEQHMADRARAEDGAANNA